MTEKQDSKNRESELGSSSPSVKNTKGKRLVIVGITVGLSLLVVYCLIYLESSSISSQFEKMKQEERQEFERCLKFAELGDAEKQNELAGMYSQGTGIKQDQIQAVKWYRKAAEQELVEAQYRLGTKYANGEGVEKDLKEAGKWLRKAAEQGHANAQYELGSLYLAMRYEMIVNQPDQRLPDQRRRNDERLDRMHLLGMQAFEWFLKAAEQGHASSQGIVGIMYRKGRYVRQDFDESSKWLSKLTAQKDPAAQRELAEWSGIRWHAIPNYQIGNAYHKGLGSKVNYRLALDYYRRSAEAGHEEAQYHLGTMYANGEGVHKDLQRAFEWYHKAAKAGLADAQYHLGIMYANGEGVQKDLRKAVEWLRKAARQGHKLADQTLKGED